MNPSTKSQNIWDNILGSVEKRLNRQIYDAWFTPISFAGCDEQEKVLKLKASRINKDWITSNYSDVLTQALNELKLENYTFDWVIEESEDDPSINYENEEQTSTEKTADILSGKGKTKFVDIEPVESSLNRKYTFDTFVVGSCNQFAHAAADAVAEAPGQTYNPMFIYGGVGLGKTHLMHAAGHAIKAKNRHLRVVYISSERFMNELINSIRYDKTQTFREKYRSIDVLLMDDVQFLAGKERTQEEFFHTFNALLEGGQQMILTCDRYPKEIQGLEDRLKSRFGWGLTVAIEPPELETRVAILMRKADESGVKLSYDSAFFIAQKIRSNVRELEGALKRVIANSHFTGRAITPDFVRESLKDLLALQDKLVNIDNIQRIVAEYYKIKISDLLSKRRSRSVARPRQVAMSLAKELTNHSLPEIGDAFGGRDHTTALHAIRKIKELQDTDSDIREDYKQLMRILTT
mgnify:CR=1 FL=1